MIEIKTIKKIDKSLDKKINSFLAELYGMYYNRNRKTDEKKLKQIIKQDNVWLLGAFIDNNLVGMVLIYRIRTITRKFLAFEEFVVDKEYRGMGIGKELANEIIEFGKKLNVDFIECVTKQDNEIAQKLYFGLGFEDRKNLAFRLSLK